MTSSPPLPPSLFPSRQSSVVLWVWMSFRWHVWSLKKRKQCMEIFWRCQMWHCLWVAVIEQFCFSPAYLLQEMCQRTELTSRLQQKFRGEGLGWLPSRITMVWLAAAGRRKSAAQICPKKQHIFSKKYGCVSFQDSLPIHVAWKGDCPSTFHSSKQ